MKYCLACKKPISNFYWFCNKHSVEDLENNSIEDIEFLQEKLSEVLEK